jgi:transcription antitermination protein NusB
MKIGAADAAANDINHAKAEHGVPIGKDGAAEAENGIPKGKDAAAKGSDAAPKVRPKSARRWSRELALQGLYEFYVAKHDPATIRLRVEADEDFKRADKEFFREMWRGLTDDWQALIELVQPHLDRKFEEVSPIERGNILIGAWELKYRLDVPYRVAINESVELAKSFGGTDGHKWVNGVLDKLAPTLRADEIANAPHRSSRRT